MNTKLEPDSIRKYDTFKVLRIVTVRDKDKNEEHTCLHLKYGFANEFLMEINSDNNAEVVDKNVIYMSNRGSHEILLNEYFKVGTTFGVYMLFNQSDISKQVNEYNL